MRLIKIAAVATLSSITLGITSASASATPLESTSSERVQLSLRADNEHSISGISIPAAVKKIKESGHWGEVKSKAKDKDSDWLRKFFKRIFGWDWDFIFRLVDFLIDLFSHWPFSNGDMDFVIDEFSGEVTAISSMSGNSAAR